MARSAPALAAELPPRALAALLADAHAPFALAAGPLVRILLLRLGPQDHLLALTLHHAVADGWSLRVRLEGTPPLKRGHVVRFTASVYGAVHAAACVPVRVQR